MVQTSIQKYRFFSIVWSIIYIVYAIVHIPIIAVSLHFAPLVRLNTLLINENPLILAIPITNIFIIISMSILCIVGVLSTKIRCEMCRIASMIFLSIHTSLNILLILIRGGVIVYCIYTISLLARGVIGVPSEAPTSTEPTPTDSDPNYSFVLIYTIIGLFLMILSAITEIIQVIFSSLVLHENCLENRRERKLAEASDLSGGQERKKACCLGIRCIRDKKEKKLTTEGYYMKMDPAAEYM